MTGAIMECIEDGGGGWDAEVAREQNGLKIVESGLVDSASEGGEVGDFGGEGLARARDGLAHAVEETEFRFVGGFFGRCIGLARFFTAKEGSDHLLQFNCETRTKFLPFNRSSIRGWVAAVQ